MVSLAVYGGEQSQNEITWFWRREIRCEWVPYLCYEYFSGRYYSFFCGHVTSEPDALAYSPALLFDVYLFTSWFGNRLWTKFNTYIYLL